MTARIGHAWPKVWTKLGKAAQNREKQEWTKEKPQLNNARRLRGIYLVDLDDEDKDNLQNMLGRHRKDVWHQPSFVKTPKVITQVCANSEIASEKKSKTVYESVVESNESTRQRTGSVQSKSHEDHTAGKGFISMSHTLVHKVILLPPVMTFLDAKATVDKEWKKLETIPAWRLEPRQELEGLDGEGANATFPRCLVRE